GDTTRHARAASGSRGALGSARARAPQTASPAASASSQRSIRTKVVQRSTGAGRGRSGLRMTRSLSQPGARQRVSCLAYPHAILVMMRAAPPSGFSLGYQPALDGLRAVSIVAVLALHSPGLAGGFLRVAPFFSLSGFLFPPLLAAG